MFETLTQRLSKSFSFLRDKKELTADNVEEGLKEVRSALLEADVHFKVVQDFTEKLRARVLGEKRLPGVDPSQQFIAAFDKNTGALLWATQLDDHYAAIVTQSATVHEGRVYVGLASMEEARYGIFAALPMRTASSIWSGNPTRRFRMRDWS